MWQTIDNVPTDIDLELAVIDKDGVHALVFPCRFVAGRWFDSAGGHEVPVHPTHWREWTPGQSGAV